MRSSEVLCRIAQYRPDLKATRADLISSKAAEFQIDIGQIGEFGCFLPSVRTGQQGCAHAIGGLTATMHDVPRCPLIEVARTTPRNLGALSPFLADG